MEANPADFFYRDDGDLMRALGCVTYEAAHFERLLDVFLAELIALNPNLSSDDVPWTTNGKVRCSIRWLKQCYADRPGLNEQISIFEAFCGLLDRRNTAVHGALYQEVDGPVMRYRTTHAPKPTPTSPEDLYTLANALLQAGGAIATGAWIFLHDKGCRS